MPTAVAQRSAIGLRGANKDLQAWLQPSLAVPIPPPEEDDWPRGKGQTFEAYVHSRPMRPGSQKLGRCKIYLQPLGNPESAALFPSIGTLAKGCTAFFGLETVVLPMLSLQHLEARGRKIRTRRQRPRQFNASDINDNLKALLPADGFTLCGITMEDIYKGDMNYLVRPSDSTPSRCH